MAEGVLPNWPAMSIADANAALAGPGSPVELEDAVIRGVPLKVYKNAPPTIPSILDMAADQFADRTYLVYQNERVTFRALHLASRTLAKALQSKFNVTKGDRVAVIMRNYPEWPLGFYAALSTGAITTPMNSWWTAEELEYGLSFAGVKVAIVDGQIYERIRGHLERLPDLKHILIARDSADEIADPRVHSLNAIVGHPNSWASLPDAGPLGVALDADDDATIMYTSGTTGKPKGALATHRAVVSNMFNSTTCSGPHVPAQGRTGPGARSGSDARDAALRAVLPRHRLVRDPDPLCPARRQDRLDVQVGRW